MVEGQRPDGRCIARKIACKGDAARGDLSGGHLLPSQGDWAAQVWVREARLGRVSGPRPSPDALMDWLVRGALCAEPIRKHLPR